MKLVSMHRDRLLTLRCLIAVKQMGGGGAGGMPDFSSLGGGGPGGDDGDGEDGASDDGDMPPLEDAEPAGKGKGKA